MEGLFDRGGLVSMGGVDGIGGVSEGEGLVPLGGRDVSVDVLGVTYSGTDVGETDVISLVQGVDGDVGVAVTPLTVIQTVYHEVLVLPTT
jgi:hypothetical protein